MILAFTVWGKPVAWQRAAPYKDGGKIRMHKPDATREFQAAVRNVCNLRIAKDWPLDRRYRLRVEFFGASDRSDVDNLAKSVMDALNKYAYLDDRQVDELVSVRGKTTNQYGKEIGKPRTVVLLEVVT